TEEDAMAPAGLSIARLPGKPPTGTLSGTDPELTIFIACYNEAPDIVPTIETVRDAVADAGCSYEIIVIDDASNDASAEAVRAYRSAHPDAPLRLRVNPVNRGLARNFVEAAFLGRGRYYKLVCGDNVESKDTLVRIFKQRGLADVILPYHE